MLLQLGIPGGAMVGKRPVIHVGKNLSAVLSGDLNEAGKSVFSACVWRGDIIRIVLVESPAPAGKIVEGSSRKSQVRTLPDQIGNILKPLDEVFVGIVDIENEHPLEMQSGGSLENGK